MSDMPLAEPEHDSAPLDPPPLRHWSPDGRFFWNGTAWQRTEPHRLIVEVDRPFGLGFLLGLGFFAAGAIFSILVTLIVGAILGAMRSGLH